MPSVPILPLAGPASFSARLTPHRSLSRWGFAAVMIAFGVTSFITGVVFALAGAWPVAGFLGLDVALVYLALEINTRDARAVELIEIDGNELRLTRISPRGRSEIERFDRSWVRVELDETADGRTHLAFAIRGRRAPFGRFLTNEERAELKAALEAALGREQATR